MKKTIVMLGVWGVLAGSGMSAGAVDPKESEGRYQIINAAAPLPATLLLDTSTGRVWVLEKSLSTNELEFQERTVVGLSKSFERQAVEDAMRKDLMKKRSKRAGELAGRITSAMKGAVDEVIKADDLWKEMVNPAWGLNEFPALVEELNARLDGLLTAPFDLEKMKITASQGGVCVLSGNAVLYFASQELYDASKKGLKK